MRGATVGTKVFLFTVRPSYSGRVVHRVLATQDCFAYPASPWLRGSNDNANGLPRQYLPKRTDLSVHDPASLARIENRFNGRPRKRLGWAGAADAFTATATPAGS